MNERKILAYRLYFADHGWVNCTDPDGGCTLEELRRIAGKVNAKKFEVTDYADETPPQDARPRSVAESERIRRQNNDLGPIS